MIRYKKEICFIINPNSGQKNSVNILDKFNRLYLKSNDFTFDYYITRKIEEIKDIDIKEYKYIIFVGGDGTISTFLQTLDNLNSIIVGTLPSGSGNALSYSLIYNKFRGLKKSKELTEDLIYLNLYNAIKNNSTKKIDTLNVSLIKSKKEITSFLFISCGIFSNIDLDTEWLRFLGSFRFILGAIFELIKYMFFGNNVYAELEYVNENNNLIRIENSFTFFMANNLSHTSSTSKTSPLSKPDDGYIYLAYLTEPTSTLNLLYILLGLDSGLFITNLKYVKTKWFKFSPLNGKYDIDGEKYDIEPIEVNIKPKSLKVLF